MRLPPHPELFKALFAVPPLPRTADARRTVNFDAAECVVRHIAAGGVTRFLYGGNAFLYHVTHEEYQDLAAWLADFAASMWPIPSLGPSYGRAIDQARVLRHHSFRCAMMLPCSDPRDAPGMEAGCREIASTAGLPLILYLKSEDGFGPDPERGLDAVARLVDDGVCVAIKYAVVRDDPSRDAYLDGLLRRVDRGRVISGMGERPAIVHVRDYGLAGLTTGSGCVAPAASTALLTACFEGNWDDAARLRDRFMPLEDKRDAWGPARVLHHATELAGIAPTGPIPPFASPLDLPRLQALAPIARALREQDALLNRPMTRYGT